MKIHFACQCGKQVAADASMAGKRAKCPGCGTVIIVPSILPVAATAPQLAAPQAVTKWSAAAGKTDQPAEIFGFAKDKAPTMTPIRVVEKRGAEVREFVVFRCKFGHRNKAPIEMVGQLQSCERRDCEATFDVPEPQIGLDINQALIEALHSRWQSFSIDVYGRRLQLADKARAVYHTMLEEAADEMRAAGLGIMAMRGVTVETDSSSPFIGMICLNHEEVARTWFSQHRVPHENDRRLMAWRNCDIEAFLMFAEAHVTQLMVEEFQWVP